MFLFSNSNCSTISDVHSTSSDIQVVDAELKEDNADQNMYNSWNWNYQLTVVQFKHAVKNCIKLAIYHWNKEQWIYFV